MAAARSSFLNLLVTLTIVTLVASLSLGYVYEWTKEPIARAQMAKQLKAIESVVSGYDNNPVLESYRLPTPNGKDSLDFFPAKKKGELIGVAVKTKSSKAYNGDIWLMVGFNVKGEIQNIFVIEHKETPGLGSKMTTPKFLQQFMGRNLTTMKLTVKKEGGDVDAITGATISTRAFSGAVQTAYETFINSASHGAAN
ncbi:MAG: RnfABCDGE type electron transport complex subunit G [Cytophagales bacterium]|jgi:electron transport complex protein RnfG|nr:RnfABCDGE type electron transport complex subunit G [Cytophagales bacterium]MCA6388423.1 RnfABCDGE type electron transport complex subunit G [Cytophagales bacterium]MCA6392524.1 RnfABCDGE type electron transport complex subunit G [Cytophagales bacterium]MCA6395737.1 RnfABCDGE type electron transport complex subunit G [Cytophagales bacterium]MCA6400124.1 RnfABCDGE type electron transport complex subunit G [Cytophagales bacterium]